jgi:hypothetical protein
MYALIEDDKYDIHHGGIDEGFFNGVFLYSTNFLFSAFPTKQVVMQGNVMISTCISNIKA